MGTFNFTHSVKSWTLDLLLGYAVQLVDRIKCEIVDEIEIHCEIVNIKKEDKKITVKILNSGVLRDNSLIILPFEKEFRNAVFR